MNTSRADALPQTAPIDSHRFFVGLGFYCMLLTAIGFGPSFYEYFTGGYYIPPLVHVHAAIMFTWLVLFTNQANLASGVTHTMHTPENRYGSAPGLTTA
jgi:hypothetical protein